MARPSIRAKKTVKTVLLSEQDETARAMLEQILHEQGFKVIRADEAERCLFLALQKDIDAFLVNIDMPGGDAAQLCARLRGIERYNHTPIILTATSATSSSLLDAFDAGADDYLEKPINPVVATARLRGHLQRMAYLREMESVRANLNRYVSTRTQQVVEDHAATGTLLEPEERVVSILFSDVRGFTTLSQEMAPGALFRMLSRHLAMQVDCVYRHGGYVDKFGGDGIMAIFDTNDGVMDACQCALEIMEATRLGRSHDGLAVLPLGIGLNLGPVLIGNIGSEDHLDYSAIGETVNLAARLCGSARPMSIVVAESVADVASGDTTLSFVDPQSIEIRGIADPVAVYSLKRGAGTHLRTAQPGYASGNFDRRGT
jgi:class 3 adenylate cyclase